MAEHIVDSLVVQMILDTSDYDKGKKKVEKDSDDLGKGGKKLEGNIASLGRAFGKFFAVVASSNAIVNMALDVAKANDELNFLSRQLGLSTNDVKAFQNAAAASGGSAQGMTNSMKNLNMAAIDFKTTGNPAMQSAMNALGVNMVDAQGNIKRTDELMLDLADSMSKMSAQQAYFYGQKIGLDEGTVSTLIQGRDAMREMIGYQKTLYQANKQDLENSRQLQKNRALLNAQWDSMKTLMARAVIPVLNKLALTAIQFFEFLQRHQHVVKAVFEALAFVVGVSLVGSIGKALKVLLAFIAPFTPFIAVVAALAAAFVLLYDDYKTWAEGGNSLIDYGALSKFMQDNEFSAKNLGKAFSEIGKQLKEQTIPTLKEYIEVLKDILSGNFSKAGERTQKLISNFSDDAINVLAEATGEKAENIGGFIGESMYKLLHKGQTLDTPTMANTPLTKPTTTKSTKGFTAEKGKSIQRVAKNIGVNPNDLAAAISFETGGTFDPSIKNKGSSATGLIQFMSGAGGTKGKYYGMSRDKFASLPFDEQMNYVERYFKDRDKRFRSGNESNNNTGDVYGAITGWGYKKGSKEYEQNKVWDSNNDGVIDKGEMVLNPSFRAHQKNYFNSQSPLSQQLAPMVSTNQTANNSQNSTKIDVKVGDIKVNTSSSTVTGVTQDATKAIGQNLNYLIPPQR